MARRSIRAPICGKSPALDSSGAIWEAGQDSSHLPFWRGVYSHEVVNLIPLSLQTLLTVGVVVPSFSFHQVRRHLIAVPRVEVIDTSTIMANLQVWASQLRAPSPATSSMMSMDRLDRVWPLDKACSNGLGGRECTHG